MSIPPRPDEVALWNAVVAGEYPAEAVMRLGIRPGRAEYLFQKWATKRRWGYGVSARTGWIEGDPTVPPWAPRETPARAPATPWETPTVLHPCEDAEAALARVLDTGRHRCTERCAHP